MSFKTSHTGSLPRPQELLNMMFAREGGEAVDEGALDEAIDRATAYVLDRQKRAGISVIGDGEMSKPSYATYIKHRLSGFGGEAGQYEFEDLEQFPGAKARVFGDTGRARRSAPACTAAIAVHAGALRRARPVSPNTRSLAPGNCSRSSNSYCPASPPKPDRRCLM